MVTIPRIAALAALSASMALGSSVFAAGKLAGSDESLLKDIAQANIAEVESGKLAVQK